jgi:hypothetical protein
VHLTSSLYGSWDDKFYPGGVGAWMAKIDAELLRTDSDHILTDLPVHWTTHAGAPGALLIFVRLDTVGPGGGGHSHDCC